MELASAAKSRGNAAFAEGDFERAISAFSEAISHNPKDHVFFSNRSACYAGLKKFAETLDDANECVKPPPSWAKGYSRKGLALFNLGRLEDAEQAYQEGLKIDAENEVLKEGLKTVQIEKSRRSSTWGQQKT
jgi:stress-induced-phosphoprotein 1